LGKESNPIKIHWKMKESVKKNEEKINEISS
jgi:hypothetical protein